MALKGIVIDPGHGGSDPGAVANGIQEKDYNLLISKYMYNRFKELGIPVKLTRETDISLSPDERTKKVQSFFGNGKDVLVISNHLNAGGGDGAEVIYALRNNSTLSKKILDELENEGQNVRKYYQQRLPSNPIKDYYFMHRDTPNNETIIVEYGFIDSTKDDPSQIKENYEKYAEAVVRAVSKYKNIKYTSISNSYYTVQKGDSLWKIANKYNITINDIKNINNLSSNLLKVGQILKIPKLNINDNVYIVQNGDTLYSIANKYGTTVDELKKINNLSTNLLQIGQKLKVSSHDNNYYIVKKGDSLWKIANQYNTTVDRLKSLNNLTTTILQVGQKLKIPKN